MKRKLYEILVPQHIRDRIYQVNVQQFRQIEMARLSICERAVPLSDLSSIYIANLNICTDRSALLHKLPKASIIAEIGVAQGKFSSQILTITQPRKLHLIDSWANRQETEGNKSVVENKFRAEIIAGQVAIHEEKPSMALEQFDEGYFDWIYIDSEYSYEQIGTLLEACRKKTKINGILAGRNYTKGDWLSHERYGVIEAVHKFCKTHKWEMIYLTHESHRNLSYAIARMV